MNPTHHEAAGSAGLHLFQELSTLGRSSRHAFAPLVSYPQG